MKKLLSIALLLILFVSVAEEEAHTVIYFYSNYCEQCDPEGEFSELFRQLTGHDTGECEYTAYNTVKKSGQAAYAEAKLTYNIENDFFPTVIVDGVVYQGAEQMNTRLSETSLKWDETLDSVIVYLYVPACESCAEAKAVLEALPESVTLKRGSTSFESAVRIIPLDASESPAQAQALFDRYNVPDEKRVTPCVFFADRYLSGAKDISKSLEKMVSLGWASGGVTLDAETPQDSSGTVTILSSALAGMVAGLNTCALSMLLLFMGILLETDRHAGIMTACFLAAKFVCYLLIGFVLLGAMRRFNPVWLKPLARIVMTAAGGILIIMNIWDAVKARKGEYGSIKNQLPGGLRGKLRGKIKSGLASRLLLPSVILLGFTVAAGEFLCAGQLYLMQLLEQASTGAAEQSISLIIYCCAFILPAAVLCFTVLRAKQAAGASVFLAEHMSLFKLLTAAVMLGMTIAAWLI